MAEQIAPTRSNLLQRRDQLKLANRGADLLKRKRDALISEFFDLVKSSLEARKSLLGTSQEAYFSLFLAKAWDGPEAVESLSLAEQSGLDVDIKVENLFGVKVPQVQPPNFSGDLPFSPINAGARTLDAASEFRKLTEALINVAATETRLRRIGEEIKKTNRRVNALEQLVIPGINQQIKDIRSVLDQRALEEVTVLKRIKAKLEARAKEENGKNAEAKASKNGSSIAEPYPDNKTSMAKTVEQTEEVGTALAPEQSDVDEQKGKGAVKGKASNKTAASSASATASATESETSDSQRLDDKDIKADKADSSSKANVTKTDSRQSPGGILLGAEPDQYIEDAKNYTSDVKDDVVKAILTSFGDAVNNRDAMTVACAQPKELSYIKKNLLKDKFYLKEDDAALDEALQEVCEKMGRSNRTKSSVTFYYLLTEKFDKFSSWS